ncbi:BRCA1-associated RING domain protein 1-like isoform X2 [Macrobrachium rosenbergii]|uniref:BRCA1-associated RING domain protein 1-like isoform X2 n=1 Tax=Macrobrachium rosenbergii TaxID=79674 RepID=UPI0034D39EA1
MDVFKLFEWEKTIKAIKHLESLLQCSVCKEIAEDAKCLGRCEHFFCAKCVGTIQNGTCPKCKIPAPPCEMQPDRIISELVASAKDLRHLLDGGEIMRVEQGIEAPLLPMLPCTPKNQISKPRPSIVTKAKKTQLVNKSIGKDDKAKLTKTSIAKSKKDTNNSKVKPKTKTTSRTTKDKTDNKATIPLTAAKTDMQAVTPEGKKFLKITNLSALGMSPSTPSINKRNSKGETMLHIACIKGDVDKVKALLEDGANPNSKDNAGWTPLHEACSHGFYSIAEMLLQHGAIVDVPGGENDENPLHDAVTQGHLELIKLLRSWGASDTARDRQGHTPRSLASICMGSEEIIAVLDTPWNSTIKKPPVMPPFLERMVLLGSGLSTSQSKNLEQFSRMLRARLVTEFSSVVSHIIVNCTSDRVVFHKTPEYFMGIASGKWIVSQNWMDECLAQGMALNPESYEVRGSIEGLNSDAPKRARMNAAKMRPGLFSGMHIFLWGNFKESFRNKKVLECLVKAGNGIVLGREPNPESTAGMRTVPYHTQPNDTLGSCSHVILYQEGSVEPQIKYNMEHIKTLPVSWFVNCIEAFTILTPTKQPL